LAAAPRFVVSVLPTLGYGVGVEYGATLRVTTSSSSAVSGLWNVRYLPLRQFVVAKGKALSPSSRGVASCIYNLAQKQIYQ
jgi:hypothetical protein